MEFTSWMKMSSNEKKLTRLIEYAAKLGIREHDVCGDNGGG